MPDSIKRSLKVFLCHSSGDKPIVREIYRPLTNEGWIDVWFDEVKLLPGQEWDMEIEKAVEKADIVIVFLSTRSVDKEGYVQKELRFVLNIADEKPEGSIFVVPLRLDDCIVPRRLRHWQWVDYFPKNRRKFAYQRLLESLKERARKLGLTPLSTVSETQPSALDAPVKSPASHARFIYPEAAEKSGEKIVSQPKSEPEKSPPSLPHKEVKEESPLAKSSHVVTAPTAGAKQPLPKINYRLFGTAGIILIGLMFVALSGNYLIQSLSASSTPTSTDLLLTNSPMPAFTSRPPTKTPIVTVISKPPTATPKLGIGSTMISEKDGMTLIYVPAGEFTMGSDDGLSNERPVHTVYLDAFWIDKTEVTNAMYAKCVQSGGCDIPYGKSYLGNKDLYSYPKYADYPVDHVFYWDAWSYCRWRGNSTRLPTEAEWEKAASWDDNKKQKRVYPWGNTTDCSFANYGGCKGIVTKVGSYPSGASPYGVLDMAGNVWEWVADRYNETFYADSPFSNPLAEIGTLNLLRGGSWADSSRLVRTSERRGIQDGTFPDLHIGFRCARSIVP